MLQHNEQLLRLITDNVGGNIFYIDADQRYQFVNKGTEEVFGLPREQIIGKRINDVQDPKVVRRVTPYTEMALAGQKVTFELERTGADGKQRSYQSTCLPHIVDNGDVVGCYVLTVDVTDRKRAETAARENEARLKLITNNVGAAIVYFDADQRYRFVNKAFEGINNLPAEKLLGQRVLDIVGDELYADLKPHIVAALTGQQEIFEQVHISANGDRQTYHSTYLPHVEDNGDVLGCYAVLVDITERVKAERKLRDNEQRLRLITDNMPGHFIYFDAGLHYHLVNKGVEELFGLPREQIIGRHSREIQGEEDYQAVLPNFERVLAGAQLTFEQRRTSAAGEVRDYQSTYLPHFGEDGAVIGCYVLNVDITERKRAEAELRQTSRAAELLRKIAVAANLAVTPDEAIQVSLDEICAYSGWPIGHAYLLHDDGSEELISANLWHLDDAERFASFRRATEKTTFQRGIGLPGRVVSDTASQWLISSDAGTNFPRSEIIREVGIKTGFAIPVLVGHGIAAVLEFFTTDIVEHDARLLSIAEQVGVLIGRVIERQRVEQNLLDAKEEAELASRSKSEFLANMSHELRTPLNAIIGFSEIIGQPQDGETDHEAHRQYAGHIYESGQHLLSLISDILDISKIETGNAALIEEVLDVDTIVDTCTVMVRERAASNGLTLTVDKPVEPLPRLYADARRIKQILINLLSNAIKFTEQGGTISIKLRCSSDKGLVIQVVDSGIGIAADDIPKALDRFQQLDSDLNRKYQGTGLGLPLTKALAEQHGGSLDLQSSLGVGTTVTVRLPAERVLLR